MDRIRIDVRGVVGAHSGDFAAAAAQLPIPSPIGGRVAGNAAKPRPSWWSRGLHTIRNAAIAVAVMTLIPIAVTAVLGDNLGGVMRFDYVRSRVDAASGMRPWKIATDLSITPMQAGEAFNALQHSPKEAPGFPRRAPPSRPMPMWRTTKVGEDMFLTARPDLFLGPSSIHIIEAAKAGFSPAEMRYLGALATDPAWRDYDIVTRAAAVDFLGGQLQLPFAAGATPEQSPVPSFGETKQFAYAAVSRASYHLARGQKDSAEAVLRSIVSYGLAFVDNGTTVMEEFIGSVIVGIGQDGIHRFLVATNDPRAAGAELQRTAKQPQSDLNPDGTRKVVSPDEIIRISLARLADPALPRGERFETLRNLSVSSCTNVRDMMFGQRTEVTDAIAKARTSLVKFPSDVALLDLEARWPNMFQQPGAGQRMPNIAVSAATVTGVVLRNPRLATCTRLLTSF